MNNDLNYFVLILYGIAMIIIAIIVNDSIKEIEELKQITTPTEVSSNIAIYTDTTKHTSRPFDLFNL